MSDLRERAGEMLMTITACVLDSKAQEAFYTAILTLRTERRLALEEAACLVDQHDSGEILHTDLAHAVRALVGNKDD